MITEAKARAIVQEYSGEEPVRVESAPDPKVPNCAAVRARFAAGRVLDLVVHQHSEGYDIEEVQIQILATEGHMSATQRRGRGSILRRGRERWLIRVTLGSGPGGEQVRLNKIVRGSKTEAEEVLTKRWNWPLSRCSPRTIQVLCRTSRLRLS
jgi:hypothetical protein